MASDFASFLDRLHQLPYVVKASVKVLPGDQSDRVLELRARGNKFEFTLEAKRSHFSSTMTNALISLTKQQRPLMVFARYISRPTGERLADAGINFVDEAGNLHVSLGENHQTLVLGKPDRHAEPEQKRVGAATVQVLFAFLAKLEAIASPVRDLATLAGVSKTAAAEARHKLMTERILQTSAGKRFGLRDAKLLQERFLEGYQRVLRPHLFIGRYRSQEREPKQFIERFAEFAQQNSLDWALTGAAGAAELDRFYQGNETTLFVGYSSGNVTRRMALVPDRKGPITLFKFFSPLVVLPRSKGRPTAHPWLIYAELLLQDDPRALEAAEEIRTRYLHV